MAQFLPLYELSREDVLMIWRTFAAVFPRSSMFFTGTDTVLLGYTEGAKMDLATAAAKHSIPEVRASLTEIGIDRVERLLDMLVMEIEPGTDTLPPGPLNTDDRPHIEYSAQRSALDYQTDTNQKVLLDQFKELPPRLLAGLTPEAAAEVARERDGFRAVLHASILRSHGDVRGTVDLLRQAARLAPKSPIIRNELAMSLGLLAAQGNGNDPKALYQEALQVDPNDFWALHNLHRICRAEEPELAAEYLRRGLQAYPDSAMFIAMRGRQSGIAGDPKAACRDLEAALRILPRRADFWLIYADFLERDGQTTQAEIARAQGRKLGAT